MKKFVKLLLPYLFLSLLLLLVTAGKINIANAQDYGRAYQECHGVSCGDSYCDNSDPAINYSSYGISAGDCTYHTWRCVSVAPSETCYWGMPANAGGAWAPSCDLTFDQRYNQGLDPNGRCIPPAPNSGGSCQLNTGQTAYILNWDAIPEVSYNVYGGSGTSHLLGNTGTNNNSYTTANLSYTTFTITSFADGRESTSNTHSNMRTYSITGCPAPCTPNTCQAGQCGSGIPDGCDTGGTIDCGGCSGGSQYSCNEQTHACVCTPTTNCHDSNYECGQLNDSCTTLQCGDCATIYNNSYYQCQTDHTCLCIPKSKEEACGAKVCGDVSDGCETISCGTCTDTGQICSDDQTQCVCSNTQAADPYYTCNDNICTVNSNACGINRCTSDKEGENCLPNTMSFSIGLDAIGHTGDRQNPTAWQAVIGQPGSGSNLSPVHTTVPATVYLTRAGSTTATTFTGNIVYDSTTGKFATPVRTPIDIQKTHSGTYKVQVKTPGHLIKTIAAAQSIAAGTNNVISGIQNLVAGDINGDNNIDSSDYNILVSCDIYGKDHTTCGTNYPTLSNLDDNLGISLASSGLTLDKYTSTSSAVDQFDYNLFLREIKVVQRGD